MWLLIEEITCPGSVESTMDDGRIALAATLAIELVAPS